MRATIRSWINRALRWPFAALLVTLSSLSFAAERITLTTMLPKDDAVVQLAHLIYGEAFRRLGYELEIVHRPSLRSELYAERGIVDGELGRGKDYGAEHPNLIQVREPALWLTYAAYAINQKLEVKTWDSIKGTGLRVEYLAGMQTPSSKLPHVVDVGKLSSIQSSRQGLHKLVAGRTDVYVDFEEQIDALLKREPFGTPGAIAKKGTLERVAVHGYLHRRHSALEPLLSAVLKDLKKEGLIAIYSTQVRLAAPANF